MLAGALAQLLNAGSEDPFAPEIVCVPSKGVERWLTQQLSLVLGARPGGFDGVCANVEFPSPGRLVAEAVASVSGIEVRGDPWWPGRSVWPLLELIEAGGGTAAWPLPVAAADTRSRLYAAAHHIAQLFDSYASYRPAMISDWAAGLDTDGAGLPLGEDVLWQPVLWRRLRELLGVPSPAERLGPGCEQLLADASSADLPSRFSLFGLTRLPPSQLAVLDALAHEREVHLWLLHPSAVLWDRVASFSPGRPVRRREDPSVDLVSHRLLSSLGRDVRELQLTLAAAEVGVVDTHHPLAAPPTASALARLQGSIRADRPAAAGEQSLIEPGDTSIQIHACHGRARQVEVVRDVILGLLAADPSLEPRDIVVMCPDIETFAPLISATFGVGAVEEGAVDPSPASQLRVRLADRSLRQTNPMMSAAATLLELVDSRMTASEVLDFAAAGPVRRRFGFDDDDLGRLTEWVAEAQVRWGLDAAHRAAFKLEAFNQNTWEAGLDRLLLGVAMAEGPAGGDAAGQAGSGWVGLALPLDDVDSSDIDLVGRLAELVARLRTAVDALHGPQSLASWIGCLSTALESLTLTSAADAWQAAQLRSELRSVVEAAGERAEVVTLTLADLRGLLADRLRGRPTRANFRTGSLTMCTLVPMRSVPHRVVCLLGLDDGAFPRQPALDGDDILLRDPLTGERDGRSEDRQLLLDAVLSARDHLVITYTGADERTNSIRPPAVPVGELLDTLDASFATPNGESPRKRVVTRHPLQPFDPANFTPDRLGVAQPFSFDRAALGGARALVAPRVAAPPFLRAPLPAAEQTDLELDTVRMFFDHPVRGFLRQRLGVTLPRSEDEAADQLPIELDSLSRWAIGERMLEARLSGFDADHCRQAEWRRGALPPGRLGARVLDEVCAEVEEVVHDAMRFRDGPAEAVDLAVELPDGRRVTSTVSDLYGGRLVRTSFGRVNAKRRFRTWLPLLLHAAARSEGTASAVTIGRKGCVECGPIASGEARGWLTDLVALYDLGLREPLPIASKTSYEYAIARRRGAAAQEAEKVAYKAWHDRKWGESEEADHQQVYGASPAFSLLTAALPGIPDGSDEWPSEPTRFGVLSVRWWDPMLEAERRALS
ncbi:MAG: exodeoxyribonuclease gamma subunit [Mycobacterium sp.]|nr:exodeoxyribonuclease gamma subunit [Mycobacterium sp.]